MGRSFAILNNSSSFHSFWPAQLFLNSSSLNYEFTMTWRTYLLLTVLHYTNMHIVSVHNQNKSICKFILIVRLNFENKFIIIEFVAHTRHFSQSELRRKKKKKKCQTANFSQKKTFSSDFSNNGNVFFYFQTTGAETWYNEYKRLTYNIPMVLTDELQDAHSHQVLHVSFSHNGRMFATCSKDGYVLVRTLFC